MVIDAGHGGFDRGGIRSNIIPEKGVALDVARRLRSYLADAGFRTVMTRSSDTFVTLDRRVGTANAQRRAIFISIHFNSAPRRGASGIETFYASARAKRLASLIQRNAMKTTSGENRGIKRARFYVLRRSRIPAVLIECGFLTNPQDARRASRAGVARPARPSDCQSNHSSIAEANMLGLLRLDVECLSALVLLRRECIQSLARS